MEDKILKMFFEPERWQYAIDKGIGKDIKKADLLRLTKPETRVAMYVAIRDGKYNIAPPHIAEIPKDNGDMREVYVNEPIDRVVLSIANDLLFDLTPEMVHPNCKAYRKGIGCGRVVQEISNTIVESKSDVVGFKADLSKYFDSVPKRFIDEAFDAVEKKHGKSALIDMLRRYYNSDLYYDKDGQLVKRYQSLKQGCSVASWLADVVLYHIDKKLSALGDYRRYSDDILYLGKNWRKAKSELDHELEAMSMKLNPAKVEEVRKSKFVKFLGFAIKGSQISLHKSRLKSLQKKIEELTWKNRNQTMEQATKKVMRFLYVGDGEHSWATQVLPIVNVKRDVDEINKYIMDAIRSVQTGNHKLGGLGFVQDRAVGCISRGVGRNVRANRNKTEKQLSGYYTLGCMRKAMLTRKGAYLALTRTIA